MINSVVLVGRLVKDPEMKYSQSGTAVTRFTLAVKRHYTKEGQPDVDFINCVTFNKQAENVQRFLKKGSMAGVEGKLQIDYNRETKKQYASVVCNSVQFLDTKQNNQPSESEMDKKFDQLQRDEKQKIENDPYFDNDSNVEVNSDDLPF